MIEDLKKIFTQSLPFFVFVFLMASFIVVFSLGMIFSGIEESSALEHNATFLTFLFLVLFLSIFVSFVCLKESENLVKNSFRLCNKEKKEKIESLCQKTGRDKIFILNFGFSFVERTIAELENGRHPAFVRKEIISLISNPEDLTLIDLQEIFPNYYPDEIPVNK